MSNTKSVTDAQAVEAIESLDDYARMMVGVDPAGPRECLYRYLEQTKLDRAEAERQAAELEKAHEARRQAQGEAADLKERMARSRIDLMRELREQGWTAPSLTVGDEQIDAIAEAHGLKFLVHVEHDRRKFATVEDVKLRQVVRAALAAQPPAQAEPVDVESEVEALMRTVQTLVMSCFYRRPKDEQDRARTNVRAALTAALASHHPAQGVGELPPLPKARTLSRGDEDGPIQLGYTADQMHAYARLAIATLTAERDALRAEVEALRDDARRLDWLDAEISGDPGGRRIMCLPGGLRDAIDAASQKEQSK